MGLISFLSTLIYKLGCGLYLLALLGLAIHWIFYYIDEKSWSPNILLSKLYPGKISRAFAGLSLAIQWWVLIGLSFIYFMALMLISQPILLIILLAAAIVYTLLRLLRYWRRLQKAIKQTTKKPKGKGPASRRRKPLTK